MSVNPPRVRRATASVAIAAVASTLCAVSVINATGASAAVPPIAQRSSTGVTADALPTVQVNGVVWAQAMAGNTVYAGGEFTSARPAGSAVGQNEIPRGSLLAFDVTSGELITSFAPSLNGRVKAIAVSPDRSRVYVGGGFTTANGVSRYRIAAYNTATMTLISTFAPEINSQVNSIAVSNNAVYIAGWFTNVNGTPRARLAALNPTSGALLGWAPTADAEVITITLSPDKSKVIAGGAFKNMNSSPAYGMGAVDAATGALMPWQINSVVRNAGPNAAVLHLTADDTAVYGSSYSYGGGNFEGTFAADPADGKILWLDDCHGDTYGSASVNGVVYNVGHAHHCLNIGGFPDTNPRNRWYHAMAFTKQATGTVLTNQQLGTGYGNFAGQPAPSIINWFPDLEAGVYTGQGQAAWSLTANSTYLVAGGEFPRVNGRAQQGLVRFAVPAASINRVGPESLTGPWTLTTAQSGGSVLVGWNAVSDRDDQALTYSVFRADKPGIALYTTTATSQFWNRPRLSFADSTVVAGRTYQYSVRATDPAGNATTSAASSITTTGGAANQPPTASFTSSISGLTLALNASSSVDPDGTIASYTWDFGDGISGSGMTTSHNYAAAGTYQVRLTVTDAKGAQGQTTKQIPVGANGVLAADAFGRSVGGGWANADTGGAWAVGGAAASAFAVNNGTGSITMTAPAAGPLARLSSISAGSTTISVDASVDKVQTGGGTMVSALSRVATGGDYRLKVWFKPAGVVALVLTRVVSGSELTLAQATINGLTYVPGQMLRARFLSTGSGPTTLSGKVWRATDAEPGAVQVTATDVTPALQQPGGVALQAYLSSSATNAPVIVRIDNFKVTV